MPKSWDWPWNWGKRSPHQQSADRIRYYDAALTGNGVLAFMMRQKQFRLAALAATFGGMFVLRFQQEKQLHRQCERDGVDATEFYNGPYPMFKAMSDKGKDLLMGANGQIKEQTGFDPLAHAKKMKDDAEDLADNRPKR